jgi:hypothetical protein
MFVSEWRQRHARTDSSCSCAGGGRVTARPRLRLRTPRVARSRRRRPIRRCSQPAGNIRRLVVAEPVIQFQMMQYEYLPYWGRAHPVATGNSARVLTGLQRVLADGDAGLCPERRDGLWSLSPTVESHRLSVITAMAGSATLPKSPAGRRYLPSFPLIQQRKEFSRQADTGDRLWWRKWRSRSHSWWSLAQSEAW